MKDHLNLIKAAIKQKERKTGIRKSREVKGSRIYEDIVIYPLLSKTLEGAVIKIDNVTEKVRLEEMMIQSEKMLSVGGLAAGMAHEINNPLAGMMQTAEVMGKRLSNKIIPANIKAAEKAGTNMIAIKSYMEDRGILRMIQTINEAGKRAAKIVENMLDFSRKSDSSFSTQDPVKLIDQILELAATDFNFTKTYDFKNIKIIKDYEKNIPGILCDKAKIQQVLLNILRNGAESMSEFGTECLNKGKEPPHPTFIIRLKKESEENMLHLEIEDNGTGMGTAIRKRIFEPFYTTKPVGIGTGLGLSVSYFIIKENHNGTMFVESEPGKGACFIIRLPLNK
ncbi:MAG: ATP-binding protein [Spirochaetaceae bacterium]|nr:ATP-binding protein [Spirochaetaceae bacterium]